MPLNIIPEPDLLDQTIWDPEEFFPGTGLSVPTTTWDAGTTKWDVEPQWVALPEPVLQTIWDPVEVFPGSGQFAAGTDWDNDTTDWDLTTPWGT